MKAKIIIVCVVLLSVLGNLYLIKKNVQQRSTLERQIANKDLQHDNQMRTIKLNNGELAKKYVAEVYKKGEVKKYNKSLHKELANAKIKLKSLQSASQVITKIDTVVQLDTVFTYNEQGDSVNILAFEDDWLSFKLNQNELQFKHQDTISTYIYHKLRWKPREFWLPQRKFSVILKNESPYNTITQGKTVIQKQNRKLF